MITGQGITPCDIMLNMTFESGTKDSAKNSFVEVARGVPLATHVVSRPGYKGVGRTAAHFTDTALNIWHFAGNEMGTSLRVEFKFKMTNNPANKNNYQIFLSNGCNVTIPGYTTPSLAIGYRPVDQSYLLAFETASAKKAIVCQRPLGAYDWHTVSLIYEDGTLLMRVDGHPCIISQDFSGPVQKTSCPLTIGADPLERESMYQGYLDDLVVARYCRRFIDHDPNDAQNGDLNPMPVEAMGNPGQYSSGAGENKHLQRFHKNNGQQGKTDTGAGPARYQAGPGGNPFQPWSQDKSADSRLPHGGIRSSNFRSAHWFDNSDIGPMSSFSYRAESGEDSSSYDEEREYLDYGADNQQRKSGGGSKSESSLKGPGDGYYTRKPFYKPKPERQPSKWFEKGYKSTDRKQDNNYRYSKSQSPPIQRYEYEPVVVRNKNIRKYGEPLRQPDTPKLWFKRNNGQYGNGQKSEEISKGDFKPVVEKTAPTQPSLWFKKDEEAKVIEKYAPEYEEIPQYEDSKDYDGPTGSEEIIISKKQKTVDNDKLVSVEKKEEEKEPLYGQEEKVGDYKDDYTVGEDWKGKDSRGSKEVENKKWEPKTENKEDYQQKDYYADYEEPVKQKGDIEEPVNDYDNKVSNKGLAKIPKIPKNKRWYKKPFSQSSPDYEEQVNVDQIVKPKSASDFYKQEQLEQDLQPKEKKHFFNEEDLLAQYKPYDGQKFEQMYGSVLAKSLESVRRTRTFTQDYDTSEKDESTKEDLKYLFQEPKANVETQLEPLTDKSGSEDNWKPKQQAKTKPVQSELKEEKNVNSFLPDRKPVSYTDGKKTQGKYEEASGKSSFSRAASDPQGEEQVFKYRGPRRPDVTHSRRERTKQKPHGFMSRRNKPIRWSRQLYSRY
ncbi:uncharacterized protein LOC101858265 [Aplysia californica]|uniref:Uncharacterized protein LOC101858265 n=1 Tax=Aplysia californica TaxID=6500 RepID=A0ABM0ZZ57_APLCA|nr:uncharacterized protein LOC101858265 [Aplysia californica]